MENGAACYSRFLEGDKEAVVEIVTEYNNGLVLFLTGLTGDFCLAEELAEDVFCELLISRPEYKGKSSFKTWLYAIARYKALGLLRRRRRFTDQPVDEMYELTDEVSIEREYLRTEQNIILHRAMGKLKADYCQVLHLTYLEGFSNAETAGIMKKTVRQIENLRSRARQALKKQLEKEGFVYEEL